MFFPESRFSFAARLRAVLDEQGLSIKKFHERVSAERYRVKGPASNAAQGAGGVAVGSPTATAAAGGPASRALAGSSYPQIHRFLSSDPLKRVEPSLEFVYAAANVLGVRWQWLATGEGAQTVEEQETAAVRQFVARRGADLAVAAKMFPGSDPKARRRRDALSRFVTGKLRHLTASRSPWDAESNTELVKLAGRFLKGVEDIFAQLRTDGAPPPGPDPLADRVAFPDHLLLRDSSSAGWYVEWSDAVLALFSRRVLGLGERNGSLWDAHSPLIPRRSPVANFVDVRPRGAGQLRSADKPNRRGASKRQEERRHKHRGTHKRSR